MFFYVECFDYLCVCYEFTIVKTDFLSNES